MELCGQFSKGEKRERESKQLSYGPGEWRRRKGTLGVVFFLVAVVGGLAVVGRLAVVTGILGVVRRHRESDIRHDFFHLPQTSSTLHSTEKFSKF
jgi:hypothetical protein